MSLTAVLEEFNVTKDYGFLVEHPLTELPEKFSAWKRLCDDLPDLIERDELRKQVEQLEAISTDELKTLKELRLAHLQLVSLANAYIWHRGAENAPHSLPKGVAVPFYEISARLEVPPVISHGTACLANWVYKGTRPLADEDFQPEDLDLIAFRMLKGTGNPWFFLLTARIEKDFAPCIYAIVKTCNDFNETGDFERGEIEAALEEVQTSLKKATLTLARMRERLEPAEFYHQLRKYLWGYNEGALKTEGIIFEGLEHLGPMRHPGSSAAQSSTLQCLDAFLGITHTGSDAEFLASQRAFMPKEHRELLKWVAANTPVTKMENNKVVKETREAVKKFRSMHLRVVTLFILTQTTSAGTGTGGTPFMQFLKKVRDDSV